MLSPLLAFAVLQKKVLLSTWYTFQVKALVYLSAQFVQKLRGLPFLNFEPVTLVLPGVP